MNDEYTKPFCNAHGCVQHFKTETEERILPAMWDAIGKKMDWKVAVLLITIMLAIAGWTNINVTATFDKSQKSLENFRIEAKQNMNKMNDSINCIENSVVEIRAEQTYIKKKIDELK